MFLILYYIFAQWFDATPLISPKTVFPVKTVGKTDQESGLKVRCIHVLCDHPVASWQAYEADNGELINSRGPGAVLLARRY